MKKILPGFLILVLIVFSACAAQKNSKSSTQTGLNYVQMWRTPCFGRCPNYKLELYSDGTLRYTAYMFTEDTGIYEKNIGAARAQALLKNYTGKKIDTLQKEYKLPVADLPGINYVFRSGNTTKEVRNAQFGPVYLRDLANEMDVYIKNDASSPPRIDDSWKKISDSPKGD